MAAYQKNLLYYFKLAFLVLGRFPNCKCKWGARDKFLIWEYTYISEITKNNFTLCLNYEAGFDPRIWVVEPDFTKVPSGELKHIYSHHSNSLCLFHPKDAPWSMKNDIIPTLITWAFLWVEFYEAWKITGVWHGEEARHKPIEQVITETISVRNQNKKQKVDKPQFLKDYPIRYES
jgi:hypothetical protein